MSSDQCQSNLDQVQILIQRNCRETWDSALLTSSEDPGCADPDGAGDALDCLLEIANVEEFTPRPSQSHWGILHPPLAFRG